MKIDPTEKRDQHCKIYLEPTVKKEIDKLAMKKHMSFSEAGRMLILAGLEGK